jgi:hypothetical protein
MLEADNKRLHLLLTKMAEDQRKMAEDQRDMASRLKHQEETGVDLDTMVVEFNKYEDRHQKELATTNAKVRQQEDGLEAISTRQDKQGDVITHLSVECENINSYVRNLQDTLEARHANLKEMEAKMAAMARSSAVPSASTGPPPPVHDSTQAFHLAGIHKLRTQPGQDPVEVIRAVLFDINMIFYMTRIQLADLKAGDDRLAARSAIIHMTSNYNKNIAVIRIKSHLARCQIQGVAVEDCFPLARMEDVRLLRYYGGKLRHEGLAAKSRVINRLGRPVLQVSGDARGKYKDLLVPPTFTHAVMEAEILKREGQPKGAPAASAERRPRPPQTREARRTASPPLVDLTSDLPEERRASKPPSRKEDRQRPRGQERDGGRTTKDRQDRREDERDRREDRWDGQEDERTASRGRASPPRGYSRGLTNGGERQRPHTTWSSPSKQQWTRPVPPEHGGPRPTTAMGKPNYYNNNYNNTRNAAYYRN